MSVGCPLRLNHVDATIVLSSSSIAELTIYYPGPGVDPLHSNKTRILGPHITLSLLLSSLFTPPSIRLSLNHEYSSPLCIKRLGSYPCCRVRLLSSLSIPLSILLTLNHESLALVSLLSCSIADELAIYPVVLPLDSKSRVLGPRIDCCRVRLLTSLSTPPTIISTLNNECSAPT
ncbi:hypothetical protein EDB86DRAFT_2825780 [Lactarius hatsudake]|nr:hypothetical protein EDB86DRAFT_2825780 [Lactarius hatsudake]